MAKIKIEGIQKLANKLNRDIRIKVSILFRDKNLRDEIGKIVVDDIKENVEFGPPAESTLRWRENYDQINRTDPKYNRDKIKALFTGELFEDLKKNIRSNPTDLTFEIAHSNKRHRKYQGKTKKIGSRSTYQEISEGLIKKLGYDYFKLSDDAREKITETIRDRIFKILSNG